MSLQVSPALKACRICSHYACSRAWIQAASAVEEGLTLSRDQDDFASLESSRDLPSRRHENQHGRLGVMMHQQ